MSFGTGRYTCGVQWHMWHCVRSGSWPLREGEIWGRTPSQNVQLQIVTKPPVLCRHLANTDEEFGGLATAIPHLPNYFGLCFEVCSVRPYIFRVYCISLYCRPTAVLHSVHCVSLYYYVLYRNVWKRRQEAAGRWDHRWIIDAVKDCIDCLLSVY